ncbi:MAG: flagellar hook-basal body complex protein FliE [Myxococcales bacterium]|jgi:flagellar hook-basal body complex protein FliE
MAAIGPVGPAEAFLPSLESLFESQRLQAAVTSATPQPLSIPFADVLRDAVVAVNHASHVSDAKRDAFIAGRSDDIHGTMIAGKEADIELKLVANVRTKLVDAFHELWRMGV